MLNNLYDLEKMYNNNMVKDVLNSFSYMPSWFSLVDTIDGNLRARYGTRGLLEYYTRTDEAEVKSDFETILYVYLKSREKEYVTLYELIDLEYNPIENYSMTETEHGNNTTDNMYGTAEEIESINLGQRETSDTITYGEVNETITNNIGKIVNTGTDTNTRAPFDSENYENVNKTNVNNTTDAREDETTKKMETKTDNNTIIDKAREDSVRVLKNSHEDTLHTDYSRNLTRSGNIGVTTSQQMIESSIALAPKFNLIDKISRDIANLVSKGVYYVL